MTESPLCLAPLELSGPVRNRLPAGTIDTHFHVFAQNAPLNTPRSYTPRILTFADWQRYAAAAGIDRGVLVQPSVYGTDNSVLLAALAQDRERLRGVVVIPPETDDLEIKRLDALGVRAIRINLRNKAGIGLEALEALAPRIRRFGWHVVFQVGPETIETVADLTKRYQLTGIVDHLAFMPMDANGPHLDALLRALDGGNVLCKISGAYRLHDTSGYAGYRRTIGILVDNHANRLLWGSDWPHTELFDTMPEEEALIDLSLDVVPPDRRDLVFARNAASIYWSHRPIPSGEFQCHCSPRTQKASM